MQGTVGLMNVYEWDRKTKAAKNGMRVIVLGIELGENCFTELKKILWLLDMSTDDLFPRLQPYDAKILHYETGGWARKDLVTFPDEDTAWKAIEEVIDPLLLITEMQGGRFRAS